ncbi:MAG: response regulator [Xanthobacteraceae bacterium]|jgi:PleD family two-component response regulator
MRILLVDDSEDARDITEAMLISAHFRDVVTATSAWEAFKILDLGQTTSQAPGVDVILLDIVMPEIDGIEACARIRKDTRYCDIPIIMVTSLEDMESLSNAFVAGATDYVTKPVNRTELVARVRAALKLKGELDRRQARERELVSFLSGWGQRRAKILVDDVTGLFVDEVAEAYLSAVGASGHDQVSVLALTVDRIESYRTTHGEYAARCVLEQVAQAIRNVPATVGVIAAAYRNGPMVLIAPGMDASAAARLADHLRTTVSQLRIANSESIVADHFTASIGAVTGRLDGAVDRTPLLAQAIATVAGAGRSGGNRVVAVTDAPSIQPVAHDKKVQTVHS